MPTKHAGASTGTSTSPSLSIRWWLSFVWIAQPAVSLVRQLATGWVASSFLAALVLLSGSGAINHMSATRYSGCRPLCFLFCFACFCRVLSPCVEDAVRFRPKTKTKTPQAQRKPMRNAIICGQLDLWHTSVLFYFANLHFASRCMCLHLRGRLCSRPVIYYRGAI